MNFPKVKPGDPYAPSARLHNALVDALAYVDTLKKTGGQALEGGPPLTWILCQNTSGSDRNTNEILAFAAPQITPTDNLNEFRHRPTISGVTPTTSDRGRFGVLLAPCKNGAAAPIALAGVLAVQIDVTDANHKFADVKNGDATKLASGSNGVASILWKESGTGTKWAIVRLGGAGGSTSPRRFKALLNGALATGDSNATIDNVTSLVDGDTAPTPTSAANYLKWAGNDNDPVLILEDTSTGTPTYILEHVAWDAISLVTTVFDSSPDVKRTNRNHLTKTAGSTADTVVFTTDDTCP